MTPERLTELEELAAFLIRKHDILIERGEYTYASGLDVAGDGLSELLALVRHLTTQEEWGVRFEGRIDRMSEADARQRIADWPDSDVLMHRFAASPWEVVTTDD